MERGLSGPTELDGEQMLTLDSGTAPWGRPPEDGRSPRPPRLSAAAEAVVAAGAGLLVLPGLGQLQRQVLMRSDGLFVIGMLLSVGGAFAAAAATHRWLGGGRRRDAAAVGAVSAALAGTAWGAVTVSVAGDLGVYLPPRTLLWATALGTVVLAVRTSGVGARLAGSAAGVTTALAVVSGLQSGWPLLASYAQLSPAPSPVDVTPEATPSAPVVVPPEPPAGPTAGALCHPDELEVVTSTPEPGGSVVATTLVATNVGTRDCVVTGWPTVQVFSAGEDLALNVHVRESAPAGAHVDPAEIRLAPGAAAQTQVWWPSWGAAADLEASQRLWVGVGGGVEAVDLPEGARWDVVHSAEAYVAPWQPSEDAG
ncbi:hypothetical protein GCM10011509_05310 [Ornithinimicrobium pekingense]|uniref:DUF4232 domain-containing protein n=1 Tax=Ornithinimicrobium pekingense TaxID=384677 RepID=A0ABQ2F417_9MICO|nr:hypothetical protein GCM10011509_05310 [Ornithinimicrobium pekingense]